MTVMGRVGRIVAAVACAGASAAVGACAPRPGAGGTAHAPSALTAEADPLVAAAVRHVHGVSGSIVGYSVDYVVKLRTNLAGHVAPGTKTGVPLAVMNDGSVWWAMMMTPSWYPFGPRPPARLQPEPASSRAAREEALAAAHLRVVRGSRLLVGALPLIDAYYVRVRLGSGVAETVGISPDGANAGVVNQAVLRPWPPKSE